MKKTNKINQAILIISFLLISTISLAQLPGFDDDQNDNDPQAVNAITQDITVQLDSNGLASITAAMVDDGSTADAGISSLSLDVTNFDCSNLGQNTVILTVTDVNSNTDTDTAIVTVEDSIAPTVVIQDITVQLDATAMPIYLHLILMMVHLTIVQ